jgi:hypothetical protein
MSKKKRKRFGTCVFCDQNKLVTDDHVPPECIFSKGYRANLRTVPGCLDCNQGSSLHDEYLFSVILRLNGISNYSNAREAVQRLRRCLSKPHKQGFAADFYSSVRVLNSTIQPRIQAGNQFASKIELDRLALSIRKIVKGIYYSDRGTILNSAKRIVVISNWEYTRLTQSIDLGLNPILIASEQVQPIVVGQGAFSYKWLGPFPPDSQYDSIVMSFYGRLDYFGLITDQVAADRWEQILNSQLLMPLHNYIFA